MWFGIRRFFICFCALVLSCPALAGATPHFFNNYRVLIISSELRENQELAPETSCFLNILKAQGLLEVQDYEIIHTDPNESPDWAARDVVKAIRDSQKPVFLWSSGKGSADALEALIQYPEIRTKVKSWISLRGIINGSPLADNVKRPELIEDIQKAQVIPLAQAFRLLIDLVLSLKEKYSDALYSFNREVRADYLEKNKKEIIKIAREINTLFVGHQDKEEWVVLKNHPYLLLSEEDSKKLSSQQSIQNLLNHFKSYFSYNY